MADSTIANSLAETSVPGGNDDDPVDVLWRNVQHLLCQGAAYRKVITGLRDKIVKLETDQESTQEKLHVARETIQKLQSQLESQEKKNKSDAALLETALRGLPGCFETAPPSPAPSAHAQNDKNFHLKVHYSKKAVIMDDKRGVVFEATENARDARNKRRREKYAMQKAKEQHGPSTVASASWSSASGSSGDGVSSCLRAAAGQSMSDDAEDGGPPRKKQKQAAPIEHDKK